jgi:hypothetical protein
VTVGLHGVHQAGTHRLAVEQDRAGPAHAVLAADVRAGQTQLVAQPVHQRQAGLHLRRARNAIDLDRDRIQRFAHACFSAL